MDIQKLLDDAKEKILRDGEHAPMVFAEDKQGGVSLFYFADLPDSTQDKKYMMLGCGREYGINHPGNPIAHLYFIVEAWMSKNERYSRPSEDPERREGLIVLHLDGTTGKSDMERVEMLRDGSGALVELLRLDSVGDVHDALLPYFVAGSLSAKMSDAELARMLTGQS